jgi:alkaline phosphatase
MDTERWILDTIEFDCAVARVKAFAAANPDTLVIITADHECAGVNLIGASTVTNDSWLHARPLVVVWRSCVIRSVGTYDLAGFRSTASCRTAIRQHQPGP